MFSLHVETGLLKTTALCLGSAIISLASMKMLMSHIGILIILTKWPYCYGVYINKMFCILSKSLKWEACLNIIKSITNSFTYNKWEMLLPTRSTCICHFYYILCNDKSYYFLLSYTMGRSAARLVGSNKDVCRTLTFLLPLTLHPV